MDDVALSRIRRLVAPPERPDLAIGTHLTSQIGSPVALPSDYIAFMQLYGPGWFTDRGHPSFQILDLTGDADADRTRRMLQYGREMHEIEPNEFPDVYPAVPGLLPWGVWDQGFTYYWYVDGDRSKWYVAVDARVNMEWYSCSFLEYLIGNISRDKYPEYGANLFSDKEHVRYCPSSKYRECFRGEYIP